LTLQGVLDEPTVEVRLPAIERFDRVLAPELLYGVSFIQRPKPESKIPASSNKALILGKNCGGASRAVWKAVQLSAFKAKMRRSASVSSAFARALSITKSLIERCEVDAAACSFAFAEGETLTSSFTVRRSVTIG
jgi:hypothetical protein